MSEERRSAVLKVALLLAIAEGWTPLVGLRARLGLDVASAAMWLLSHGFIEAGVDGSVIRWGPERSFEDVWAILVPDRACPLRFRVAISHSARPA